LDLRRINIRGENSNGAGRGGEHWKVCRCRVSPLAFLNKQGEKRNQPWIFGGSGVFFIILGTYRLPKAEAKGESNRRDCYCGQSKVARNRSQFETKSHKGDRGSKGKVFTSVGRSGILRRERSWRVRKRTQGISVNSKRGGGTRVAGGAINLEQNL